MQPSLPPMSSKVQACWTGFKAANPSADDSSLYEVFGFGDSARMADELGALVVTGTKRATAGALWSFEVMGASLPRPGSLSIVTDGSGAPLCIIETIDVQIVPFDNVSAEFAATEGEGDGSLEYWRAEHINYFQRECARIGREFADDMPVVCECFKVVHVCSEFAPP
jgi:uncharacterized protein YhfF